MKGLCSSAAVTLIDEAGTNGLTIRWTTTGFAVRVPLSGKAATVLYAYPRGVWDRTEDFLQGYVGYLPEGPLRDRAAALFAGVDQVIPRGELTYELAVTPDSLSAATQMWSAVLEIAELARSASES